MSEAKLKAGETLAKLYTVRIISDDNGLNRVVVFDGNDYYTQGLENCNADDAIDCATSIINMINQHNSNS